MKNESPSIDIIQTYVSNGLLLHPHLQDKYEQKLCELERSHKLSFLPVTRLMFYCRRFKNKKIA